MKNTVKAAVERCVPKYTTRRLLVRLAAGFITRPLRIFKRINAENWFLHRQFGRTVMRCNICGNTGSLFFDMPDRQLRAEHAIGIFRETLACRSCGSSMRQRTLAHALMDVLRDRFGYLGTNLDDLMADLRRLRIWDTDAFSVLGQKIRLRAGGVLSKFNPESAFGCELETGVFNIDLQKISFGDNHFDVILSSDIMEHVRDDRAAHREIFRCLKPGGAYIFTVPYREDMSRTLRLIDTSSRTDVYLTRPHYHGDPITGGILAYRIYGRELIDELRTIGFEVQFLWLNVAAEGIFAGDCFVASKPKQPLSA